MIEHWAGLDVPSTLVDHMWCWPSWSMELGVSIVKGKLEMYNNMATGGMQVEAQVDYFGLCGQGGSSIFRPCCMWNSGKESACDAGDPGSISGLEDPLEEGMATHSSTLVWKIPWTEDLVCYSSRGHKKSDTI